MRALVIVFQSTHDRFPRHAILRKKQRNGWNSYGEDDTTELEMDADV